MSTAEPAKPKPKPTIVIRQASLSEYRKIGRIAAATYYDKELTKFLNPYAGAHYAHYERAFTQRCLARMLDPRNLTLVACSSDGSSSSSSHSGARGEEVVVGYTQIERLGDDEGARRQIASRRSVWLSLMKWVWTAVWCPLLGYVVGGDKSLDPEALRLFVRNCELDDERYWKGFEDRRNRWYVQSCVVRDEFQGLGIGKRLVGEAIRRADAEGVVVGLEASTEGEPMYRRVGFELLGRYDQAAWGPDFGSSGGIMMWSPEGWKGKKDVVK